MKKNTGKEFEKMVFEIFEDLTRNKLNYEVIYDTKIDGPDKPRQIDILIKINIQGKDYNHLIECKDFIRPIDLPKLDAFDSLLRDLNAYKGTFISSAGFTDGAKRKAIRLGIDIFTAHKSNSKWNISLNIPVIVKEYTPTYKLSFDFGKTGNQALAGKAISIALGVINNTNVIELFKVKLYNKDIPTTISDKPLQFKFPELNPPYFCLTKKGEIPITDYKFEYLISEKKLYGTIDSFEHVNTLISYTKSESVVLFDFNTKTFKKHMSEISEKDFKSKASFAIYIELYKKTIYSGATLMKLE